MKFSFFLIPFITSFATWLVLWLVIKSLFYPLAPKRFGILTIQGIIPAKQIQLAMQIGNLVKQHLLSVEILEQKLIKPETIDKILPEISDHVDAFLRNKLPKSMPMISMFIGDKTILQLKEIFMQELAILFPTILQKYINGVSNDLDLEVIITEKIAALAPASIATNFYSTLSKEINKLLIVAAVIGFIFGLIQLFIIWVA